MSLHMGAHVLNSVCHSCSRLDPLPAKQTAEPQRIQLDNPVIWPRCRCAHAHTRVHAYTPGKSQPVVGKWKNTARERHCLASVLKQPGGGGSADTAGVLRAIRILRGHFLIPLGMVALNIRASFIPPWFLPKWPPSPRDSGNGPSLPPPSLLLTGWASSKGWILFHPKQKWHSQR